MDKVITISREFGCGGREVGIKLAEMLGVPFYDKDIISKSASEEISQSERELLKESYTPPFFENVIFSIDVFNQYQNPVDRMTFLKQAEVIRRLAADLSQFQIIQSLAAKGPCVIVGRSAGYVLKETALKVFIRADLSARVQRKLALGIDIPEDKMPQHIQAIGKKRSQYYQHYTDQIWGDVRNYNLCIDTTEIGTDGGSELILCYLKQLGEIS